MMVALCTLYVGKLLKLVLYLTYQRRKIVVIKMVWDKCYLSFALEFATRIKAEFYLGKVIKEKVICSRRLCLYCCIFITAITNADICIYLPVYINQQSTNTLTDIISCNSPVQSDVVRESQSLSIMFAPIQRELLVGNHLCANWAEKMETVHCMLTFWEH